jgi:hypothetical protein
MTDHQRKLALHILSRLEIDCQWADILIHCEETSRGEILFAIGYEPKPDFDAGENWSQEALDYAEALIRDFPEFLINHISA